MIVSGRLFLPLGIISARCDAMSSEGSSGYVVVGVCALPVFLSRYSPGNVNRAFKPEDTDRSKRARRDHGTAQRLRTCHGPRGGHTSRMEHPYQSAHHGGRLVEGLPLGGEFLTFHPVEY